MFSICSVFNGALSHTLRSPIRNPWHKSVDHPLHNAVLKKLLRNNLNHLDCLFHDRKNRNVSDLLLNPFRHNLLLDPLYNLHLWNFLNFHWFLHRLEFHDVQCRLPCNDLFLMGLTDGRSRSKGANNLWCKSLHRSCRKLRIHQTTDIKVNSGSDGSHGVGRRTLSTWSNTCWWSVTGASAA